ncbi:MULTISPECIES: Dps family protein [Henriciella]|uniref:DNA starvation/stationary phase protection protein n=1 Tax=Henriciella pelagia TaxID=1977912 RepID=A0ABQ1JT91_9PROT|nr:Dps family protein [Henriciella pelagia]GGB74396.1 DNA starvation/stationary phase protection protein [Henriciella pelagia]
MPIDIGLTDDQRKKSVEAIRKVLGETYALYSKTHSYHWNVTGPRFQSLHAMFMEQYTELWAALDELAERIRALDYYAPASTEEMYSYATIRADNGVPDAEAMVTNLSKGHEAVARAAREGVAAVAEFDDVTADMLTQRATIADKTAWMLRASL